MSSDFKINFRKNWIEELDNNSVLVYSDTDSQYTKITLPFKKNKDVKKTVVFTQTLAKRFNENYLEILDTRLHERAGLDPDYNPMNFKSEIVAFRGFFRSKKYYALAKIWDEGNFLPEPKLKFTGGQIKKADVTQVSLEMLKDIYYSLVLNFELNDEEELFKDVFIRIYNEYKQKLDKAIKEFNINYFGIPKKWGVKEFKSIPSQVIGAMFYNLIISDSIRPGDSIFMFQIKIKNMKKIVETKRTSQYQLPNHKDFYNKLNYLCIPYGYDRWNELKEKLIEYQIEIDYDNIMDFNIDKKIIQFKDLFDEKYFKKYSINIGAMSK